jgi:RNase H-fold protein (predicted Holliday junction resolvase)
MPCDIVGSPVTMAGDKQQPTRTETPRPEPVEEHQYLPAVATEIDESTEEALRRREQAHRARAGKQPAADTASATEAA